MRGHVACCMSCTQRVHRVRETRRLLRGIAEQQLHPQHDIAQRAVRRLQLRHKAIGNVNEVLAAVRTLIRSLAGFLGGESPLDPPATLTRHDGDASHG